MRGWRVYSVFLCVIISYPVRLRGVFVGQVLGLPAGSSLVQSRNSQLIYVTMCFAHRILRKCTCTYVHTYICRYYLHAYVDMYIHI